MKTEVDMHLHSNYSDGSKSPAEIVLDAQKKGMKAICLTDHDTVDGLPEFICSAKKINIEAIPGIEISCRDSIHVLGYGIDFFQTEKINRFFVSSRIAKQKDFLLVLKRYRDAGVMDVDAEEIRRTIGFVGQAGTLHVAEYRRRVLNVPFEQIKKEVCKGGICRSMCDDCNYPTTKEAIDFIHELGGVAILAHPANTFFHKKYSFKKLHIFLKEVYRMKSEKLDGIEVYHSKHSFLERSALSAVAKMMNFLATGGSDSHGCHKNIPIGNAGIDHHSFVEIKNKF
ncbi:MAG: PHP domain-containing protein [Candidatus Moranbacteria bacterium]|nr:PHP domain-containing protein [Candidatus Moranbacteria bacterium]